MNSTYYKFDNKYYKQAYGTPMVSPISPIFSDIVMQHLENIFFSKIDYDIPLYLRYVTARRRFTRPKGDPLLREAWKRPKSPLRQGIKKSRLQCWKDLIGEVKKNPWGLAFKIVTKRLVTRRKTPGLDNTD